jgi:uncharacterized protein YjbI with pentapeptide repeats
MEPLRDWTATPSWENRDEVLARYAAGERDFPGVVIFDNYLVGEDLRDINMSGGNLRWTSFNNADLRVAILSGADLAFTCWFEADLRDADLSNARLENTNLQFADLRGADLSGASLARAHLTSIRRDGSPTFDATTIWPTDPELLDGTRMDGLLVGEWAARMTQLAHELGPNQGPAWAAIRSAAHARLTGFPAAPDGPTGLSR